MSSTIASQLQAIKSVLKGSEDQIRRPITRPSVIFDPKEAADIDLRAILPIARSGLEVLTRLDVRFESYKDTLFSHKSLEIDREKMVPKEEEKLNSSICSYLRLLAGHLQLHAALKTLEYLIRRYRVHVFNMDELVLCALPYHDTHTFVRIVQLLDLGNKNWAFLDGVKASGAPPPRRIIVQQCIRDKGVLEALCNYASPTKEFQHSRPVICFCTAVIVEALGAVSKLDTDTVKRILPFVFNGLNPAMKGGRDHKAGALMVVGLLTTRATLASKLVHDLISFIARVAELDAKQSADLAWLRVTIMAIISLVQSQSVQMFPKKTIHLLKDIRDLAGVLSGLSKEFHIHKFLCIYLETLVEYSLSDYSCRLALISTIEILPLKDFVDEIVSKVLGHCIKLSKRMESSNIHETGSWAKQIFLVINQHYPSELQGSVHKFLENTRINSKEEESVFKTLCLMFDGSLDMSLEISDSKVWFSLEHPKAMVRQATLSGIAASGIVKAMAACPQKLTNIQDAMIRRFHDDDLSVVQTALSIDGLSRIINPPTLLKAYHDVLCRCIDNLNRSTSSVTSQSCDVAMSCLERIILDFPLPELDYSKEVGTMIFPLLLILPKTWRVNLKALELVKEVQWPFYRDSCVAYDQSSFKQMQSLEPGYVTSINMKTIGAFAETFVRNPRENMQWLIECSNNFESSKSLYFFIILQAFAIHNQEVGSLLSLFEACFPALNQEWHEIESRGCIVLMEEFNMEKLDIYCRWFLDQLLISDVEAVNSKILICIYWSLLKAYTTTVQHNSSVDSSELLSIVDDLFLFFATSPSKSVFRKHVHYLVTNCIATPFQFLSKYFAEEGFSVAVQLESLLSLETICSGFVLSERTYINTNNQLQLLLGFPSLLIPLSSENKDVRMAAVSCIEGLYKLWRHFARVKNGNDTIFSRCVSNPAFGDFLELILSQKKLISSDVNFLPSYLTSMLSPSGHSLLVPQNIHKRFDQPVKDGIFFFILSSALEFSSYRKLRILSLLKGMGHTILHVEGVKSLLFELLERCNGYHLGLDRSCQELSTIEIETLCLLLEVCVPMSSSSHVNADVVDHLLKALKVDGVSSDDLAIVQPCVTVLQNLTCAFYDNLKSEIQDKFFGNLVFLFRSDNGDIRNAAREVLLRINISWSTVAWFLELVVAQVHQIGFLDRAKRKKSSIHQIIGLCPDVLNRGEMTLSLFCSLLDILLLKKDIGKRDCLVEPLFKVLGELFSNDWYLGLISHAENGSISSSGAVSYAQQATLLILEDISTSLLTDHPAKDDIFNKFNMNLLVECARDAKDVTTRNHVFMLLSAVAKISSEWLSEHIIDIFTVIGESAVKQNDSHSQQVLEKLISALVPCWLSKTESIEKLLQIFINILPEIAGHRRLTLMVYLLRTLGEKNSLGVFLHHLFRSLIVRMKKKSSERERNIYEFFSSGSVKEWEYIFAVQLCDQYSCKIWFPCLVMLLQEIGKNNEPEEQLFELHLAMQFVLHKLQDTELIFELESAQGADCLQDTLEALMEEVVLRLQLVSVRSKQLNLTAGATKELKKYGHKVLKTITRGMAPSAYFKGIIQLLGHADGNIKKKTLGLLCETVKDHDLFQKKRKETRKVKHQSDAFLLHIDESTIESYNEMCSKIVQLIDGPMDSSDTPVKLAAFSSLEVLAKEFPSDKYIFSTCLTSIVKHIGSNNLAISSGCLRTTGALISVLGSKALSQLPHVMRNTIERAHEVSACPTGKSKYSHIKALDGLSSFKSSLLLFILITLEAVVENLAGFLNPYLEDILDLMVLHPEYALGFDQKMKMKAATVRKLLSEKVPVRLLLTPMLKIYPYALKCGESSLSLLFEMLASMISAMDRSSIASYHAKIFEQCLLALDLRRQCQESVKKVEMVEQSVIQAIIVLTMKLTETMFRPLFIHTFEWAESELEGSESIKSRSLDRTISFYKLVNKLTEQHRSLFVPYFKYLLEACIQYLTNDQEVDSIALSQKRKKAKVGDAHNNAEDKGVLSPKQWHLRALVLKSLYKCFLFDTADQKFLDSSNFQVLLKPIVSQLVVEPPASLEHFADLPTVEEVDESLVCCLGQMAVTARSDLLWKPLNHEVLMQTRNLKLRPRILGLKVVKYLVEHLKEEYLVFLPETIPFLGELLEDVELPVKSLAQEILKEMETLSGESLRQYL